MPNPTLSDVADKSNVSLATVDRVINNRAGVSERTKQRVMRAAAQLGYIIPENDTPTSVRLAFVLPEGTNAFVHELAQQLMLQVPSMIGVTATVERVKAFNAEALAQKLQELEGRVDGIAMLAMDHPIVREAVRRMIDQGIAVCTLGSDVRTVGHLGYIGIDDTQAGRLAGYLLGRLMPPTPNKIAFFAGSLAYRGHQEREMGFRQILREDFPNITVVEHCEVQDNRDMAEAEMERVLAKHPDLHGVYNAGGGTSGIASALAKFGQAGRLRFIAHDATQGNKSLLLKGVLDAVIDQNARAEIREALITLTHAARQEPYETVPPRLQIIFRENLPNN
ncbi:LacI family DNA-binding transcriptional regulator [Falsihalocynthiibacter sp. SS001]|uniref:LacI family DNA-binding transcriptional regulator n=1 Tax=Falsihalocynthiibacter sp. SS001 TaxID=3349698 RepID=UPI0036D404AF